MKHGDKRHLRELPQTERRFFWASITSEQYLLKPDSGKGITVLGKVLDRAYTNETGWKSKLANAALDGYDVYGLWPFTDKTAPLFYVIVDTNDKNAKFSGKTSEPFRFEKIALEQIKSGRAGPLAESIAKD